VTQGGGADTWSPYAQRVVAHGQAVSGNLRVLGRRAGQRWRNGCGGDVSLAVTAVTSVAGCKGLTELHRCGGDDDDDGVAASAEPQRLRDRQLAERVQRQGAGGPQVPAGWWRRGDHRVGQHQVDGAFAGRRFLFAEVPAGVQQLRPVADRQRRCRRQHAAAALQSALPAPALQ